MTQSINEQIGLVAAIESERHFFAVGLKMLGADTMPTSDDAALEKRERGFNGVRVDVALGVDAEFVTDSFVPAVLADMLCCALVSAPIVGVQDVHVLADILADVLFERARLRVFGMEESQIAAALTDADNDFLVVVFCFASFPPILAANIRFVHFYFSAQHGLACFHHRGSDSMTEIPRCFVASESKRSLNLARGHALLGLTEKQRSDEPLGKRQERIVEDGASGDRELVVTTLAVIERLFGLQFGSVHLAARAAHAFGPAQLGQNLAALFIGREHLVNVN